MKHYFSIIFSDKTLSFEDALTTYKPLRQVDVSIFREPLSVTLSSCLLPVFPLKTSTFHSVLSEPSCSVFIISIFKFCSPAVNKSLFDVAILALLLTVKKRT